MKLNRHEKRHNVARKIFYGQRSEVRKRYREGQEDQLGALGLVVNAVALWNSFYLDRAVEHLRGQGEEVREEDLARVSPLVREHVHVLGRYQFTLEESVAEGGMRPSGARRDRRVRTHRTGARGLMSPTDDPVRKLLKLRGAALPLRGAGRGEHRGAAFGGEAEALRDLPRAPSAAALRPRRPRRDRLAESAQAGRVRPQAAAKTGGPAAGALPLRGGALAAPARAQQVRVAVPFSARCTTKP